MQMILNIQPELNVRIEVDKGDETDGTAEYQLFVYAPSAETAKIFEMRLEPLWHVGDMYVDLKHMMSKEDLPDIRKDRSRYQAGDFHQHTIIRHVGNADPFHGFSFTRAVHEALVAATADVPWLKNIYSTSIPNLPWEGPISTAGQRTWQKYIDEGHPRVTWLPNRHRFRFAIDREGSQTHLV